MLLKIGTRGSPLALAQTNFVAGRISKKFPSLKIQIQVIKTTGDKILDAPLSRIGSKGLFTKEIEEALLRKDVDLAVHSLKDLPSDLPQGLAVGAFLKRADPRDCLVSAARWDLKKLPSGAKIGTSSLRRQSQLLAIRRDLKVESLRGNLDTRIRKLREGNYDAIILAAAGMTRLKTPMLLKGLHVYKIPCSTMLPAAGQGALAIEIRKNDPAVSKMVRFLDHGPTRIQALCERAYLSALEGGCQVPIGIYSRFSGAKLHLDGLIASASGDRCIREKISGPAKNGEALGRELAQKLLIGGGRKILDEIRS